MYKSVFEESVEKSPEKGNRSSSTLRLVLASLLVVTAVAGACFGGFYYAKYQTAVSAIDEMKANLEKIERKVSDIPSSAECNLDEVGSRLDDIEKLIKDVGIDLSEVASDVTTIKSDVASIESDVSSIQLRVGY